MNSLLSASSEADFDGGDPHIALLLRVSRMQAALQKDLELIKSAHDILRSEVRAAIKEGLAAKIDLADVSAGIEGIEKHLDEIGEMHAAKVREARAVTATLGERLDAPRAISPGESRGTGHLVRLIPSTLGTES